MDGFSRSVWLTTRHRDDFQRNRKQSDLPDRFAAVTESFAEDEASAVLTRLERAFKKLSGETNSSPLESRLAEAQSIVKKQKAKLAASARSMSDQIDGFHEELIAQEIRSVEASADEVDRYVSEAQRAFRRAMKGAHEDLVEEWEGWDSGLGVRSDDFRDDLMAIQAGAPETSSRRKVTELKDEPNVSAAASRIVVHSGLADLISDLIADRPPVRRAQGPRGSALQRRPRRGRILRKSRSCPPSR